jgi:integrase
MSKRKRGSGEGSIYRLQDGRWRAAVTTGWKLNAAGKKVPTRKTITKQTRHEVASDLKKSLRDQQRGFNINPNKLTVRQFLSNWLNEIKSSVAPATYVSYEATVRLHLVPSLGDIQLGKLSADHVQRFKAAKLESVITAGAGAKKAIKGQPAPVPRLLSPTSVKYCLVVLRLALESACKLDLVPRNIALLVDFPKTEHVEIQPYTPEQSMRFLEAAKGHRIGAIFSVALAVGLRKGEALGLKWPAIDFGRGTLAVRVALQRIKLPGEKKGELLLREPKRSSKRTINLPQVCISALLQQRGLQEQEKRIAGSKWKESGYVFTSTIGTPLEPRNLHRAFSEIVKAAHLPMVRIHDLRHACASLLLIQGVHPRMVMELLGHSQIGITLNLYSHLTPELRRETANQMDAILSRPKPDATTVATKTPNEAVN